MRGRGGRTSRAAAGAAAGAAGRARRYVSPSVFLSSLCLFCECLSVCAAGGERTLATAVTALNIAANLILQHPSWTNAAEYDSDGGGDGLDCSECGHSSEHYDGFFTFEQSNSICDLCPKCIISHDWSQDLTYHGAQLIDEMHDWAEARIEEHPPPIRILNPATGRMVLDNARNRRRIAQYQQQQQDQAAGKSVPSHHCSTISLTLL